MLASGLWMLDGSSFPILGGEYFGEGRKLTESCFDVELVGKFLST